MIKFKEETESVKRVDYVKCDECERKIFPTDHFEYQETYDINFIGGFGSVFGDGSEVDCQLCQYCFKEKIIDCCRIDGMKARGYENS